MSDTMSFEQSGLINSGSSLSTTVVHSASLLWADRATVDPSASIPLPSPLDSAGPCSAAGIGIGPWYVCFTKPRQEAYAASKLREQGYEFYLPFLESWARRAGQWCKKQTVMFPRYAFVRPAVAGQSVAPVRSTPGVSTLVRFGPVLATLGQDRLEALQALLAERSAALPGQPLALSQHVVFASGPLKGMAGIVSNVAGERVSVLMTLLGQQQNLVVSANELAPQNLEKASQQG